jgi:hypothetical protein
MSGGTDWEGEVSMIAALYVLTNGPYFGIENVDPWDQVRDAKQYKGPHKVIAHPPCERWGRYWSGGPMLAGSILAKSLGDDEQCFAHALWSVRTFGGVLEHPEASHAWDFYGLPRPNQKGGWTELDKFGGRSCCVAQGNYGHQAQKLTWLYGVQINFADLKWGLTPGMTRIDEGFHSKEERARLVKTGVCQRLSKRQRQITPEPFRDLLINMLTPQKTTSPERNER